MSEVVVSQLITFVGALLSGALGGYIAIRVSRDQLRHHAKMAEQQRAIDKIEDLHKALSELSTTARLLNVSVFAKITKGVDTDRERFTGISFEEMNMLVDFYVPSLRSDADAVSGSFDKMFAVAADVFDPTNKTDKNSQLARSLQASRHVDEAVKSAKIKLAALMRPYAIDFSSKELPSDEVTSTLNKR